MKKQISELLKTSEEIIKDCSFPNGAIVAANSTKPYFPKEANNYKFVWPRDAMYICDAGSILGLDIQEKFFKWCMKAESWEKTGLFYQNYFINGKKLSKEEFEARNNPCNGKVISIEGKKYKLQAI